MVLAEFHERAQCVTNRSGAIELVFILNVVRRLPTLAAFVQAVGTWADNHRGRVYIENRIVIFNRERNGRLKSLVCYRDNKTLGSVRCKGGPAGEGEGEAGGLTVRWAGVGRVRPEYRIACSDRNGVSGIAAWGLTAGGLGFGGFWAWTVQPGFSGMWLLRVMGNIGERKESCVPLW